MKIVFVSYNNQPGYPVAGDWMVKIRKLIAVMEALAKYAHVSYIKYTGSDGQFTANAVDYLFLRSTQNKSRIPRRMNKAIRNMKPDVVVVAGLRYPLQIMQLRWSLGKKVVIIGRHHADKAPPGFRRVMQKLADRCINAYLFTSVGNAKDWMEAGIIKSKEKMLELLASSTEFSRVDKEESKKKTVMSGGKNFLWVGGLNENKDPVTVLTGFEQYLAVEPRARLYMVFQEEELLEQVKQKIAGSKLLEVSVNLVAYMPHDLLREWYSAADYFISGSHSESTGFALLEAMACGCIPIVTAIPSALKITMDGKYGIIFKIGNANDLADKLTRLSLIDSNEMSISIENHFRRELSSEAIAARLYGYCGTLLSK